jgi:hypothetical protein
MLLCAVSPLAVNLIKAYQRSVRPSCSKRTLTASISSSDGPASVLLVLLSASCYYVHALLL